MKDDLNIIEYFNKFSSNCKDVMVFIDFDSFEIIHINQRGKNFYKLDLNESHCNVNYFSVFKFNFVSTPELIKSKIQKSCNQNGYFERKSSIQFKDGSTAFCDFIYTLIDFDENNKYLNVKITDISKHREHQIDFCNSLSVGVIYHSNEHIKFTNFSFNNNFKEPDDLYNKSIYTLFSNLNPEALNNSFDFGNYIEVRGKNELTITPKKYSIKSFIDPINDSNVSILYDLNIEDKLKSQTIKADLANQANILLESEIFKHKETQYALNHSQEISKSLFNSSLDTIISSDLEGNITEISPSAITLFGYSQEELIGKSINYLYNDIEEYKLIEAKLKKDGFFSGEIINKDKSNRIFPTFLSCSTMKNNKGQIIGYIGISRDISDIIESQKRLVESEKKFRELFTYLSDGILILDINNKIIEYNIAAQELLPIEEGRNNNLFDFIHTNDQEKFNTESKAFREKGYVSNIEFAIVDRNKEIKQILLSSTAIYENEIYVGSRDIIRDITSQKITEKLVENQNSKLQSIFENESNILIWTIDTNLNFTSKNSNIDKFFKLHFDIEIKLGDNLINLLKPLISKKIWSDLNKLYDAAITGTPIQFEGLLKNSKTGKSFWLETFLSPTNQMIDGKCELTGIAIDISEKKTSEIELTKSVEEKEILLKEVHHRVKNNLQVISSILNLQSSYVKDPSTLNILRESQNRVKSMSYIHEILYRSKDFSEVNFTDYINNLTNSILHTFLTINNNIFLELDLDHVNLNLDQAIPCGLIVNEIVTNAMKYAFEGIEKPVLTVRLYNKNNTIYIHIDDNGVGLPADFKAEESDSLGLQLVYTLIDQIDGSIEVNVQNGTKYLITFVKVE